ncbi:MAG: valine--tRNA ligase [Candidatus Micrarchaeaceae archaeon]
MVKINTEKWIALWKEAEIFKFKKDSDNPLFVIDVPPPFTNGSLHMGQAYWVTYVDAIARYMKMKGRNVLYPIGWDTQGLPTELAVEKKYGKKISREEFFNKCKEFANENKEKMKDEMHALGAIFDEDLEYITMSDSYHRKVQLSLLQMYEKGFIYKAKSPVEWCTHCNTAIASAEIEDREVKANIYQIKFAVKNSDESFTIATTRPEMLHACVAVAFNPNDERYKKLEGKIAITPIFKKEVPIISDEQIDKEFGTGIEMICTFGDKNDVLLFYKHNLNKIEAIEADGTLLNAGPYTGMNEKDARLSIIKKLKEDSVLEGEKEVKHTVRVHGRCETPVEIISSEQWFIKTKEYAAKLKEISAEIEWIPEEARQRMDDWINGIKWDWSISRNRIFGTPLPFWHCEDCGAIIPASKDDLPVNPYFDKPDWLACPKCGSKNIAGEKDTCDVWVDSSITPMVIAGWPDDMELFKKAFPATMRIQGTDIIRTWAFYTILRTFALTGEKPFEKLLANGMVLGSDGREMHKSYGNGVTPKELLEKYNVDAIRLWVALSGTIGKNKVFSYKDFDYAEGFINKLYNSALFVKNADAEIGGKESDASMNLFDLWILNRLNDVTKEVEDAYDKLDLNTAMNKIIDFYWHEFCDYYIEEVKHKIYNEKAKGRKTAAYVLKHVLMSSVALLAPVMPFAAEDINSMFESKSIFLQKLPEYKEKHEGPDYIINGFVFSSAIPAMDFTEAGAILNYIIAQVRKEKSRNKLALNKEITAININLPEKYYSIVKLAEEDILNICKAKKLNILKNENESISIEI